MSQYAFVQHSGYTAKGDFDFYYAVEFSSVTPKQAKAILAVGGIVFDGYSDAAQLEETVNYPDPNYMGLTPRARGAGHPRPARPVVRGAAQVQMLAR